MEKSQNRRILSFIIGPVLFGLALIVLPRHVFGFEARGAIGLMLWMTAWWIMRPVYIGVTALLPVAINAIFAFIPMSSVIASYSKPIFFLLIGTNLFSIAWTSTGLDKRIALRSLLTIGTDLRRQVVIWFVLATILSTFLANVVVTATLVPIAISMLAYVGEDDKKNPAFVLIMLAIAWGAGLGGFGTPLGGGMNLVSLEYIQQFTGTEYSFLAWSVRMLPILGVLSLVMVGYMLVLTPKGKTLAGADVFLRNEFKSLGKISRNEIVILALFVFAVLLTFLRPFYKFVFPNLAPFYIFFILGIALFFIPKKNGSAYAGEKLLTWEFASGKIMWGLLILFSGGLALGDLMIKTGAASSLAQLIMEMNFIVPLFLLAIFVVFGLVLSNVSSNTAACAILMPIVLNTTMALGMDVVPMLLLTTVAANSAFVLPTSVRAIPAGYGLAPIEYLKKGFPAIVLVFVTILALGSIILNWIAVF